MKRVETLLFCAAFIAYAWFHQGGGWNQNARFAEVRAMAEEHVFAIDDFLVYTSAKESPVLTRQRVRNGDFTGPEGPKRLAWTESKPGGWNLHPVNGVEPEEPRESLSLEINAASGDVAFFNGHFHPNKPPGTSFFALPTYLALLGVERCAGIDPDNWWALTCNEWLASVFSVGIISAFGCVLFLRCALLLGGDARAALAATLAFAFGTMFFPYATLLFDQNLTATALLAAFYCLLRFRRGYAGLPSLFAAGLFAGIASVTNYVAAPVAAMLALYFWNRKARPLFYYALGVAGPFALVCAYGILCFHNPFALNTTYQNPLFKMKGGGLLGMFALPNPYVALLLLVSPFRGIFYTSPVLLLAVYGWSRLPRGREKWLIASVFGLFFFVNTCFNGYHGGFCSEPRYLGPAIPFLALPLVFAFLRLPRVTAFLAAASIAIQLLITAVDVESPAGVGDLAMIDCRPDWKYSPLAEYTWPIFWTGHAWPLLDQLIDRRLQDHPAESRSDLVAKVLHSEEEPFLLATFRGPVSVNPVGAYEGYFYRLFPALSREARWNSFNIGEFLFPESRLSLFPLLAVSGSLVLSAAGVLRASGRVSARTARSLLSPDSLLPEPPSES